MKLNTRLIFVPMICFKSRSIIFHVNSFGYNSCSELLLVTLAALAIALLPKAVLALQQANLKHLQ